jgi:hypothetical protein
MDIYADTGLRTLLLAKRIISEEEYEQWNQKYIQANRLMKDREMAKYECYDLIEKDM